MIHGVYSKPPIFILGVPRSGTTLLRALLDSHSAIACGPETPWLGGHQPRSVMSLWKALRDEPWGFCKSFNMPSEVPTAAARQFVSTLMTEYATARGKSRWAEKTPDNALHVGFLAALFPEAKFIHLVRDGLDVAMSTSVVAVHRRGISKFLEQRIGLGATAPTAPNSTLSAVLRWKHWNTVVEESLREAKVESIRVSYERLVSEPESTLRDVLGFVGEDFEPAMLDYARSRHDFPSWEWGSADVQERQIITKSPVGRGRRELPAAMYDLLSPVTRPVALPPTPALLTPEAAGPDGASELVSMMSEWGVAMGLDSIKPDQFRSVAWLWASGVAATAWKGKHLLSPGPFWHPLTWVVAMLGAKVTIVCVEPPQSLQGLARSLAVQVGWTKTVPTGMQADAVLAFEPATSAAITAIKPGAAVFVAGPAAAASWMKALSLPESPADAAVLVGPS